MTDKTWRDNPNIWATPSRTSDEYAPEQEDALDEAWNHYDGEPAFVEAVKELLDESEQDSGRGDGHAKGDVVSPAHARHFSPRPESVARPMLDALEWQTIETVLATEGFDDLALKVARLALSAHPPSPSAALDGQAIVEHLLESHEVCQHAEWEHRIDRFRLTPPGDTIDR